MVGAKLLPLSGEFQNRSLLFAVCKLASKEICDNYVRYLEQKLVDLSSTSECTAEEYWN